MEKEKSGQLLSAQIEIDLLKMEYNRMAEEIRMYVKEYFPKFSIFFTFVIGGITIAWNNERFNFVYPMVPYFLFVIAGVTISQAYIIACLAERVRQIECRITEINLGKPILVWESTMALKLIYAPFIKLPYKNNNEKLFWGINPIFVTVLLMIIAVIPIIVYCLYKTWIDKIIPPPLNIPYFALTIILSLGVFWQSTSFFRLGNITAKLNYYE